jgi:hypothetical protein
VAHGRHCYAARLKRHELAAADFDRFIINRFTKNAARQINFAGGQITLTTDGAG